MHHTHKNTLKKTQKIYTILSRISSYSKKIEIELAFQELACQKKTNSEGMLKITKEGKRKIKSINIRTGN